MVILDCPVDGFHRGRLGRHFRSSSGRHRALARSPNAGRIPAASQNERASAAFPNLTMGPEKPLPRLLTTALLCVNYLDS